MKNIVLLISCFFMAYSSYSFCQNTSPEVYLEMINSTDTRVTLKISEEITQRPYTYVALKTISLDPGRADLIPVLLTNNEKQKRVLSINVVGESGYGMASSAINLDISKSLAYKIELTAAWVYPGDDVPVDPFRVIKANLIK